MACPLEGYIHLNHISKASTQTLVFQATTLVSPLQNQFERVSASGQARNLSNLSSEEIKKRAPSVVSSC